MPGSRRPRPATDLGAGFCQPVAYEAKGDACGLGVEVGALQKSTWVGSRGSTHGTHVASTVIGSSYRSNFDAAAGFALPPILVRGIAPDATIIPVRMLGDDQIAALPKCGPGFAGGNAVFGTGAMVAAGIRYATGLAIAGYRPMVINMSLGGPELEQVEKDAIDHAVANGVIVVAAAGNEGEAGMGFPGAYPPVISAGSAGWAGEWLYPGDGPRYRMWWLQYPYDPLPAGSGVVGPPTPDTAYVSDFSSRALVGLGQQLDVLAPVAALMLQKDPGLNQAAVESIMKSTALPLLPADSRLVFDFDHFATIGWDTDCAGTPCDAVGAGLLQADAAVAGTP